MSEPLLQVDGLSKAFGGVEAVRDVSFTLHRRERLAIIGPNGAGKSTCFNLLNGQLTPDRGRVALGGRDTTGLPPPALWRAGVGRTFQVAATFLSMTVRENVQVALLSGEGRLFRPWGWAGGHLASEADALCALVGLGGAGRPCGELAYGDLKRLELAVALANRPSLLLMDEPTAGMSPNERAELMQTVDQLSVENGLAVLFTEHDMDVVFAHADRIIVLDRGRIIANGPPDVVRHDSRVQAVYLGRERAQ